VARQAARAVLIAANDFGASSARVAISPGHRRIGGHRTEDPRLLPQQCDVGQAVPTHRDRHRQVQQDFPGSCVANGLRHGANATERAPPNPAFSAVRSNITAPAWDTTPVPVVSTDNDG